MAPTPVQDNLVKSNEKYVSTFTESDLALPPAKKYAVGKFFTTKVHNQNMHLQPQRTVTCMDARLDTASALGITLGDAHVIRNAGGSAKDALRSLVLSQQLLGTQEVLLVKHTGCGMLTFQNEDALGVVKKNLGDEGVSAVKEGFGGEFLAFPGLEDEVRKDVEWLKENKAIAEGVVVSGWVYAVETGKVRSVV